MLPLVLLTSWSLEGLFQREGDHRPIFFVVWAIEVWIVGINPQSNPGTVFCTPVRLSVSHAHPTQLLPPPCHLSSSPGAWLHCLSTPELSLVMYQCAF